MDLVTLQPKYLYGLRTDIKGNVNYINDDEVIYPVGAVIAVHNYANNHQKYIRLPDKGNHVNLICVSPNKKVIAVAETGDTPTITIYDSATLKRKRQLPAPTDKGVTAKIIECMAFTSDSKSLIAVYGEPEWFLFSYKYDKGKIESSTRGNNMNNTGTVRQVACNPMDVTVVVLVGDVLFRMLAVTESAWRQYGYSKADLLTLRCATWLSQERLVTGTHDGRLLMVENGELKAVFRVNEVISMWLQGREDIQQNSAISLLGGSGTNIDTQDNEVRCIISFPKGFAVECGTGRVHFYEMETPHKYNKRNIFVLDPEVRALDRRLEDRTIKKEPNNRINFMCVNPSQDYLLITCGIQQLFQVYLWGPDITKQPEVKFQELGPSMHRGAVKKISVCQWKPILMTAGFGDRTLRVWHYEKMTLIMCKYYQEDIFGVGLHPTGLYALAGFSGKLKFLTILINDFAVTREFPIRYCQVCRFSKQGHLFGAVNANIIQIYSSITFENLLNLKGHNANVVSLDWTEADRSMVTCGNDGALYQWDILTGKRTIEVISKVAIFTGTRASSDGSTIYCTDNLGEVKDFVNGTVRTTHLVEPGGLHAMVLSRSDQILFTCGLTGSVYSVRLPLSDKQTDHMEFIMHNTKVGQLRITYDDKYLISCSLDGSICVWKLVNATEKQFKLDKDFQPSVDILIPYIDLQEKIESIRDLYIRMSELDRENAYQIRLIESKQMAKLKEIHEAYKEVINQLKDKNDALDSEHVQEIHAINQNISDTAAGHDIALQNLEATYNEKLRVEYSKYSDLENKVVKVRKMYDDQLEELAEAKKNSEESITQDFLQQLSDKDVQLEEMRYEMDKQLKDHEVVKEQIEDDADREIYEMKTSHEGDLKEEQSVNIRLRAENGIIRKKLTTSQKDIEELKHQIFTLENEQTKFKMAILDLEKDIVELKKEINERDETIQEKERKIYDLKKRTQELEKYKYVLEFNIDELKSQIEPRERKIFEQKEQMNDMVVELENFQKRITSLELQVNDLKGKLFCSQNEFKAEKMRFRQALELIKGMRNDLYRVSGIIQEPIKLKILIKEMYHKYNADKEFVLAQEEDCDVKTEFQMQRYYLEKSVSGLKEMVAKKYDKNQDKLKIIDESAELISETNRLRNQLKVVERQNRQMESILGISQKSMKASEAKKRLADAAKTKEQIHMEYQERLKANESCINALREENARLVSKFSRVMVHGDKLSMETISKYDIVSKLESRDDVNSFTSNNEPLFDDDK